MIISSSHKMPHNFGTDKDVSTYKVSKYITIKLLDFCVIIYIMIQDSNLHQFNMAAIFFVDYHIRS